MVCQTSHCLPSRLLSHHIRAIPPFDTITPVYTQRGLQHGPLGLVLQNTTQGRTSDPSLLPAQYPFSGRKTCLMPQKHPRIRRIKITSARRYSRYPAGWLHHQHVATNLAGCLVLFSHAHSALRGNALSCKPSESYDVPTRPFYR
jgi:hypothetical protein